MVTAHLIFVLHLIGRNKYLFLIGEIARLDVSSTKDVFSLINANAHVLPLKLHY